MANKITQVRETNLGIYVWQLPDGSFVSDDEMNVLSITAMRGDLTAMAKISSAAKYLGFEEGRPIFAEGYRKISDGEWQDQRARMALGLTPDPYDIGVFKEELRRGK